MVEPKISVITACFNHGKYIHEMIDSVLNQTFQDFEIIIVNDGSTDDTQVILQKIRHDKIQIIHTEHRGPSHARNTAIANARAQIIFNLDADDKIASDLFEKAYNVFSNRSNIGIVYTNCEYFGSKSGKMDIEDYSFEGMLFGNKIVSAAFFTKYDWKVTGGYSEGFVYGLEDWDLWLKIIKQGREIIKISDSYFYYRSYENPYSSRSGIRKASKLKMLYSLARIMYGHKMLYVLSPFISCNYPAMTIF